MTGGLNQHAALFNEGHHIGQAIQGFQVGHDPGAGFSVGAHAVSVVSHDLQVGPHMRSQVGLVDHEQIAFGDAGAAFAGGFFRLRPRQSRKSSGLRVRG